ncbi:hypothetical protein [Lactiplantibacillus plajomi]|uniref:Uncharacterized protein n=1 Tax=Lactiplantibacillus plajomi TaxID=1457217 RepID=A0ABV6K030_9LACO|nr:hypothetical protein [Lactiplantibacillus plajomi]
MLVLELMKHPEWFRWDENQKVVLIDAPPQEAQKAYQEYLDFLKYQDENEIDF